MSSTPVRLGKQADSKTTDKPFVIPVARSLVVASEAFAVDNPRLLNLLNRE